MYNVECSRKFWNEYRPTITLFQVWSMLLRSLHSIIIRTDWRLISEIIVVDDASTFDDLRDPLDRYVALLPVRTIVLRNPSRQGLMRSRVNGARIANGTVIVFMDAHAEVNVDWLVPMLREIEADPMLLAIPHLDTISPYTIRCAQFLILGGAIGSNTYVGCKFLYIGHLIQCIREMQGDPMLLSIPHLDSPYTA